MNDKYSTTEGKTSEKLSDEAMLSAQWKNIDWHKAEQEVNRLQIRIVKATQQKDYNAVKRLQYLLTHSFYAKALAVKRVVTNDGRKTPGVDGVLWNTPAKKMKAVLSLTDKGYRARPLRRVYIEKKDKKKKRPLGIQAKLAEGKSMGYARWAKRYNLKEMSKTLIFLQEHKIGSIKEMQECVDAATARYHELGDSIKAAEARMAEIAVLRTHIVNYARTRPVYDAYRKAGYSKRFLEAHREEITLHKAAKAAFDEAGLKKLPKAKDLSIEYAELLKKKKEAYPDYRKARDEMQELMKAQKNVEMFFAEEKDTAEKEPTR